jgi:hypothetical protein
MTISPTKASWRSRRHLRDVVVGPAANFEVRYPRSHVGTKYTLAMFGPNPLHLSKPERVAPRRWVDQQMVASYSGPMGKAHTFYHLFSFTAPLGNLS